ASTWPPSRSLMAGPPPLYGTCRPSVCVCCQNSSAERWSEEPLPEEAKLTLPGVFFRCASSSATLLSGELIGTTSTLGACTATVIGSRSFSASYCTPLIRCGAITNGPREDTNRV